MAVLRQLSQPAWDAGGCLSTRGKTVTSHRIDSTWEGFMNERKYLKNLTSKTVSWYEQSFTSKDCLDKLSKGKSHDFNFSAKPLRRE